MLCERPHPSYNETGKCTHPLDGHWVVCDELLDFQTNEYRFLVIRITLTSVFAPSNYNNNNYNNNNNQHVVEYFDLVKLAQIWFSIPLDILNIKVCVVLIIQENIHLSGNKH